MGVELELLKRIEDLERLIYRQPETAPKYVPLTTPLTSTSWDGDARSTTAKTLIDLSAVFGVPAGVKAVLVRFIARDSGSSASTDCWALLSPNSDNAIGGVSCMLSKFPDDAWADQSGVVTCNTNGDIYYQIRATGTDSMDVILQIWGYWI